MVKTDVCEGVGEGAEFLLGEFSGEVHPVW